MTMGVNTKDEDEYIFFKQLKLKVKDNGFTYKKFNFSYSLFDNEYPKNINIDVTKNELLTIKKIDDYKYQKLLFAFLTLSKYYFLIGETDDYIFHKRISSIFGFSKVHAGKIGNKTIIDNLISLGYITKIEDYYKVNFVDNNSDVEISTNNVLEVMGLLPSYCEICGRPIKKSSNNRIFCDECYYIRQKEQNRIRYERRRI